MMGEIKMDPDGSGPLTVSKLIYPKLKEMAVTPHERKCIAIFKGHNDPGHGGYDPIKYNEEYCSIQLAEYKH